MAESVKVEGLTELIRAFQKLDGSMGREMRTVLKRDVGAPFARAVQQKISAEGLVGRTRRLRDSIKPNVKNTSVQIKSSPALKPGKNSRMGYAAVYEYGHGRSRAFLDPTLDSWRRGGQLETAFGGFMDWVADEFRKG